MRCKCSCDGCAVGGVWYAPGRGELSPEGQWHNMPGAAQEGQEGSEGQGEQGEQEEETRAERGIREDLLQRAEEYGAAGGEQGAQRTGWRGTVARRLRAAQTARGTMVVVRAGEANCRGEEGG